MSSHNAYTGTDGEISETKIPQSEAVMEPTSTDDPAFDVPTLRRIGWFAFAIAGVGVCLLAGWFGLNGVSQVLLWVVTAASGFAAVLIAWNAFAPSNGEAFRPHLAAAAAALAVLSFVAYRGLAPALKQTSPIAKPTEETRQISAPLPPPSRPSKEAAATQENWRRTRQILISLNGAANCGQRQSLPELIQCLQDAGKRFGNAASDLSNLPVQDVDPDFVALVARYIRLLDRSKNYLNRMGGIYSDRRQLEKYANSPDAFVESAIRGFVGDPLGKFREINESNRQLGADFRDAQRELRAITEAYSELRGEAHRLRALIGSKYGIKLSAME